MGRLFVTEITCPSAVAVRDLLARPRHDLKSFVSTGDFNRDSIAWLEANGVQVADDCDVAQILLVLRDYFSSVSDEDLTASAGGEIKAAAITAAAAIGAVAVVGTGIAVVTSGVADSGNHGR